LPSRAPAALREGYRRLATTWTQGYDGWEVQDDRETTSLPTDRPVWVLGWENLFRADLAPAFQRVGAALEVDGARLPEAAERLDRDANSVVLVAPGETAEEPPRAFLGAHLAQALPGLTRKLPHYGKYGYLAFQGEAPDNTFKGQWQMRDSPLSVVLAEGAAPPLPKPPALTRHLAP
jgi:hypothetical protein